MSARAPLLRFTLPAHRRVQVGELTWCAHEAPQLTVHPHAALVFIHDGAVTMSCGPLCTAQAGDVLVIPDGVPHHLVHAEQARATGVAICPSCLAVSPAAPLAALIRRVAAGDHPLRTLLPADQAHLRPILDALRAASDDGAALAADGLLAWLAAVLDRAASPDPVPRTTGPSLSARALTFIREHGTRGISLIDVARHVARSPAHTAAVVKAETGHTVVAWITEVRLAAARQLLLHTDDTIDSVGLATGFQSVSHFHRTFKRAHGAAPGGWRAAHGRLR